MQIVYDDDFIDNPVTFLLPSANDEIMPDIKWGFFYDFFTPAFWASRMWLHRDQNRSIYKIGSTLIEEVAACLLGGHGMKSEVALAAYYRVRDMGLLEDADTKEKEFRRALEIPLEIGGRKIRYRYPNQKSRYLHQALSHLRTMTPSGDPRDLRNWLMTLPGIGPKTASWITRNWLDSDEVAIIDIHIHRAGILCGLFPRTSNISTDYFHLEERFLRFAEALGGSAAVLDTIVWRYMKELNHSALRMLQ
jgi:thermostable 8-oxoguanine DNA glycosylase